MSKFTGKCDLYDHFFMIGEPSRVKNTEMYLNNVKVELNLEKDLIPYCTHLISSGGFSKESGDTIYLSNESFIDSEEKEFLSWKVIDVIKAARKAKKEKKGLTVEYLKSQKNFWAGSTPNFIWKAIIDVIEKNPDLVKTHIPNDSHQALRFMEGWIIPNYFDHIHDPMHNRFREEFVKFGEENGYAVIKVNDGKMEWTEGVHHPMFTHMCFAINEYYKMEKEFA